MVPAGEAGDVLDLGQDPSSDQRLDAVKIDQVCGAPLDQPGDPLLTIGGICGAPASRPVSLERFWGARRLLRRRTGNGW